jgi:hypothetical protein
MGYVDQGAETLVSTTNQSIASDIRLGGQHHSSTFVGDKIQQTEALVTDCLPLPQLIFCTLYFSAATRASSASHVVPAKEHA